MKIKFSRAHLKFIPLVLLVVPLLYYYFVLVTSGEMTFIAKEKGATYESMWRHLAQGQFDVDKKDNPEQFERDGRDYTYFGIFPALIRGALTPIYDANTPAGRLTCLLGALFILTNLILTGVVFGVFKGKTRYFSILMVLTLLLGSPVVYILGPAHVYHQALFWGTAFSTLFNLVYVTFVLNPKSHTNLKLLGMAAAVGTAFLTRVPESLSGGMFLAAIGFLYILKFVRRETLPDNFGLPRLSFKQFCAVACVLIFFGAAGLFVNYERWGNPLWFSPTELQPKLQNTERLKKFRALSWDRFPVAIEYYFIPHTDQFMGQFPFLRPSDTLDSMPFANNFDYYESATQHAMLVTTPFLIAFAILGCAIVFSSRFKLRNVNTNLFRLGIFCGFANWIFMLSYTGMALRYHLDFLPNITLLGWTGIYFLKDYSWDVKSKKGVFATTAATILSVTSIIDSNIASLNHKIYFGLGLDISKRVEMIDKFKVNVVRPLIKEIDPEE